MIFKYLKTSFEKSFRKKQISFEVKTEKEKKSTKLHTRKEILFHQML